MKNNGSNKAKFDISMKICHVTTVHPPNDVRIFIKECTSLAAAGHDVSLVVAADGDSYSENGVKVIKTPVNYRSRPGRIFKAPRTLCRKVEELNPDVVHFHDPELLLCVKRLKRKGFKVIYDVHEDLPRQILSKAWIPGWIRKLLSVLVERYENSRAAMADHVITATPFIANRFRKVNPATSDVRNYPIPEEFAGVSAKRQVPPHLCYVGGITAIRGIYEMLKAVEEMDALLELAGPVESDELLNSIKQMPGWRKSIYHGVANRSGLAEIMSRASAGLALMHPVPNYIDAFPTKLFEYMLAGLPVVYSGFPLWRELFEPYNCGIAVDPLSPMEVSDAVRFILENPDRAAVMGENGRRAALEHYNWNIEREKLLGVYNSLEIQM